MTRPTCCTRSCSTTRCSIRRRANAATRGRRVSGTTGTTGEWNAVNGSSSGWQRFEINIPEELGPQVEISITALSDWGFQQFPGVSIDDIEVGGTTEGDTSFEEDDDPMDGWTVPGAPQDDAGIEGPNRNDWVRRGGLGIKEGAGRGDRRHGLSGLRARGHHGRRETQRRDGSLDRLPPRFAVDRALLGSP
jgi:hypothetical protein